MAFRAAMLFECAKNLPHKSLFYDCNDVNEIDRSVGRLFSESLKFPNWSAAFSTANKYIQRTKHLSYQHARDVYSHFSAGR